MLMPLQKSKQVFEITLLLEQMEKFFPRLLLWLQSSMSSPANAKKNKEFGQCPLCTCNCHHVCTFGNYFQGTAYKKENNITTHKRDLEKQAREWMNYLADVNMLGVKVAGDCFEKMSEDGRIGKSTNIPALACKHGALAAATHAIYNPPNYA